MTRTVFWAAVGTAITKGTGTVLAIKRGTFDYIFATEGMASVYRIGHSDSLLDKQKGSTSCGRNPQKYSSLGLLGE